MKSSYNVFFLCTGDSARSIMAEAIMNRKGAPRFRAYSAGSYPSGKVRPEALRQIENAGLSADWARSKSWDEFSTPDAHPLDFVFTVCDNAANEVCPICPGQPMTAHWECRTRRLFKVLQKRSIEPSRRHSPSSIGESASSSAFRSHLSIRWHCNATLMTSAASNCYMICRNT